MEKKCVCPVEMALGMALLGKKKLTESFDSLEKKRSKSSQQLHEFLHDAQSEGAKCKQVIGEQFKGSAKKTLGDCGFVTADDVAQVRKEIEELKDVLKSALPAKS